MFYSTISSSGFCMAGIIAQETTHLEIHFIICII